MATFRGILTAFLAKDAQTYAGGDLPRARRLGAVVVLANIAVGLALLPFAPPTAVLGAVAWPIIAALLAAALWGVKVLRRPESKLGWNGMLALSYLAVIQVTLVQAAAGEAEAPYRSLYLLIALHAGAIHPPRRVIAFLGTTCALAAVPLVLHGGDRFAVANTVALLLLTCTLASLAVMLMTGIRRQRIEMSKRGEQAEQQARSDALTSLGNRRAFDEELTDAISRARSEGTPLSLIVADLDNFKSLNDEYGHIAGDRCLGMVADSIRSAVRETDLSFRWGGDEFAVVLRDADGAAAAKVTRAISSAVAARCRRPDGEPLRITCAYAELGDHLSGEGLMTSADMALLSAKDRSSAERHTPTG